MSTPRIEAICEQIAAGDAQGIYLVVGDLVLSEPAGDQIGAALSQSLGTTAEAHRRPPSLQPVLDDLRTFSLFDEGKIRLVVESALLADRNSAAGLIDEAAECLPVEVESELTAKQRQGAARLLQALRVFGVEPRSGPPSNVLAELPNWAFQGGPARRKKRNNRARGKKQVADLKAGLEALLEAAVDSGMVGWAEGDLAQVSALLREGLPQGHHLILVESAAQKDHPLTKRLTELGALINLGGVSVDRRGTLEGVDRLAAALVEETGRNIDADALRELAERTLRKAGGSSAVDAVSTGRFAAEFRKLANLAQERIDLALVRNAVEDRGDEDVFKLLDEISAGNTRGALRRLDRHLQGAEDAGAAVFGFFALLAQYAQHIAVVRALIERLGLRKVERNYRRFQSELVGRLQAEPAPGIDNPIANLHPFRLHRIYLAAARWSSSAARQLPWMVLEAETRLKGDSSSPPAVLSELVLRLAHASAAAHKKTARRG